MAIKKTVIKFLVTEKWRPCEIYRRMCNVYGEAGFSQQKNVHNMAKLF